MAAPALAGQRLTLVASARRYDLMVPEGTRVSDVLSILGIASSASPHGVATPAGHLLGPHDTLDAVASGIVLTVVRMPTHAMHRDVQILDPSGAAPGSRDSASSGGRAVEASAAPLEVDDSTRRRDQLVVEPPTDTRPRTRVRRRSEAEARRATPGLSQQLVWLGGGLALVAALVVLIGGVSDHPTRIPAVDLVLPSRVVYAVASVLLLLATVGVTVVSRRAGLRSLLIAVAPALAFGAAMTLPLAATPGRTAVAFVAGCAFAVVALALARTRTASTQRGNGIVMAVLGALGTLTAIGTAWEWPPAAIAGVAMGVTPLIVRILPTTSFSVDPTQLLDTDRLSTTTWSVRERRDARRRRVVRRSVDEQFQGAREVVAYGTAYLALIAVVAGWVLALQPIVGTLPRWAAVAATLVVSLAFAYQSRTVRDRLPRWSMLCCSAALLGASVAALQRTGWPSAFLLTFLAAAGLGWIMVMASALILGGYRSTRFSRLADALEGLTVALALPLSIMAANGIEALRRVASG